ELVQVPTCFDDRTGKISAEKVPFFALYFEDSATIELLFALGASHPCDLCKARFHAGAVQTSVAAGHFDEYRFSPTGARLQIANRVSGYQLALIDDDDLFTSLFNFGQNVSAQDNGMVTCQAFYQIASFIDLLRVKPGRGFIEDEHDGIVDNRLGKSHSLTIALR